MPRLCFYVGSVTKYIPCIASEKGCRIVGPTEDVSGWSIPLNGHPFRVRKFAVFSSSTGFVPGRAHFGLVPSLSMRPIFRREANKLNVWIRFFKKAEVVSVRLGEGSDVAMDSRPTQLAITTVNYCEDMKFQLRSTFHDSLTLLAIASLFGIPWSMTPSLGVSVMLMHASKSLTVAGAISPLSSLDRSSNL